MQSHTAWWTLRPSSAREVAVRAVARRIPRALAVSVEVEISADGRFLGPSSLLRSHGQVWPRSHTRCSFTALCYQAYLSAETTIQILGIFQDVYLFFWFLRQGQTGLKFSKHAARDGPSVVFVPRYVESEGEGLFVHHFVLCFVFLSWHLTYKTFLSF